MITKEIEFINFLKEIIPGTKFENHVFSIGGFERDLFLNIQSKDLDLVIDIEGGAKEFCEFVYKKVTKSSKPRKLGAAYPIWNMTIKDNIMYGKKHFQIEGVEIDVAESMRESFPDIDSRQRTVEFGTFQEDIERRDFTINMLARNLSNGELIDNQKSILDIEDKIIRVHPNMQADTVFSDDPLRMLRCIRFSIKYNMIIDASVKESIKRNNHRIEIVSKERILKEIIPIAEFKHGFYHLVLLLDELDLLKYIFPELHHLKFVKQQPDSRKIHLESDTVLGHVLEVLKNAKQGLIPQLAALCHDLGKTSEIQEITEDSKFRFIFHEVESGKLTEKMLKRLKFPNKIIEEVKYLVENHMKPCTLYGEHISNKSIRRFIRDCGENMEHLLDLTDADSAGTWVMNHKTEKINPVNGTERLRERIKTVQEMDVPKKSSDLLNGNEIMEILGLNKGGPVIGTVKEFIKDLEDERGNVTKEDAIWEIKHKFSKLTTTTTCIKGEI